MMNLFTKSVLFSILLAGSSKSATLTFSKTGGPFATGFGDSSSNIAGGLIWGIVVDTAGDGFATSNWSAGFNYTPGSSGIALVNALGLMTDDVLYIDDLVIGTLSGAADGAADGVGRVNTISSVGFNTAAGYNGATGTAPTVAGGQAFAIVWFDRGIALNSTSTSGQKFGLAAAGTVASPSFLLPGASSDIVDYTAAFLGADPTKSATFSLIPEPSSMMLVTLGTLALLLRRRR